MHPLWTMGQPSCSPRSSSSSPRERKFPAPPARSRLSSRGRLPCKSRSAPPGLCRPPRGRLRAGGTQKSPPSRGPDSLARLDNGLAERPWATASPASVCGAAQGRSGAARGPSGAQLPPPGLVSSLAKNTITGLERSAPEGALRTAAEWGRGDREPSKKALLRARSGSRAQKCPESCKRGGRITSPG
ncbi:unnamed protein product, partial [Coccothraustes coccothraustes]